MAPVWRPMEVVDSEVCLGKTQVCVILSVFNLHVWGLLCMFINIGIKGLLVVCVSDKICEKSIFKTPILRTRGLIQSRI